MLQGAESQYNDSMVYPEERIHRALIHKKTAQFRLSLMADRDLALAVEGLCAEDREAILACLPPAKTHRVQQEREYLHRLHVSVLQRRTMVERLADALEGRQGKSGGTWIAPGSSGKR